MHKSYRIPNKIVKNEGGRVVEIQKKYRMDKVKIEFGNCIVGYNFSTSKHCNMDKMVKQQIRRLRNQVTSVA